MVCRKLNSPSECFFPASLCGQPYFGTSTFPTSCTARGDGSRCTSVVLLPCHELLDAGGGSKARRQQGHRGSRRISATPRCRRKVAIESGLCRSGRTGGTGGAVVGRPLGGLDLGSPARRGKAAALGH